MQGGCSSIINFHMCGSILLLLFYLQIILMNVVNIRSLPNVVIQALTPESYPYLCNLLATQDLKLFSFSRNKRLSRKSNLGFKIRR